MFYGSLWTTLSICLAFCSATPSPYSLDPNDYNSEDVIRRDVAVIGGGSSGTYTAVRLKDNMKSVVLIEKEAKLGGHAQTYTAPNGYTIDYGVIVFVQTKVVEDYFSRFNVSLIALNTGGIGFDYVDFSTGKTVNLPSANVTAETVAFETYAAQLAKYPSLQSGFNMSYPVQPDLLLTFGEFIQKYSLGPIVPTVFVTNQGYVPILNITMLYMFKYLSSNQLNSIFNGFLTTKNHDIYALYAAAGQYLETSNVLTSSVPIAMNRSTSPVRILVQTLTGKKLVVADKLVSTIPPTLNMLSSYDLSPQEKSLFSQWKSNGYYTGILNNTGLNTSSQLANLDPGQPYDVPKLPGVYTFSGSPATGLTQVYYGSPTVMSNAAVQADIEQTLARVQKAQNLTQTKAEWVVFSSHAPFNLEVSNEAIEAKFYQQLYALNGERNTFYNGAAFQSQDSSALWQFTEDYVLPLVLSALS